MEHPDTPFGLRVHAQVPRSIGEKHVSILGMGSLGGLVARTLAQCGVRRFTLIDADLLEAHNLCRHVGGMQDVGSPKVDVVARILREVNPAVEVRTEAFMTKDDPVRTERLYEGVDVLAGCTDDFTAHQQMNEDSLLFGIPATYGTVFDRGEGGKVVLVEPAGPLGCLHCSEGLNGSVYKKKVPLEDRYGVAPDAPWVALAPFVGIIALQQAWLTLWALAKDLEDNAVPRPPAPYIATTFVELRGDDGALIAMANRNYFDFPPIHPRCTYCKARGRVSAA